MVLPRWIPWLGIVAAVLSILSLTSLVFFPASVLILLGRLLAFVWSVAVGILLVRSRPREAGDVSRVEEGDDGGSHANGQ